MSETIQPEGAEPDTCPRVFVTYSHDSEEHKSLVREFCTVLRRDAGVDVHLDQWDDDGRVDWSLWAMEQIREADFILAIASPAYRVRAEGLAPADEGRGAQFEAALLRDGLTRDLVEQTGRILPVVLPGRSVKEIPSFLRPYSTTHYLVDELTVAGVEGLLAALNNVAKHPKPERGTFAGNPYAELHAQLQAEEQVKPPDGMTNHGFANFGIYKHRGDNIFGDKNVGR
jgi:hypothetical protein